MGTLQHINAGEPHLLTCHCCTSVLGDERAVANTPSGPRYFCKADPEHPFESCYLQYRRRFNRSGPV
jgi:hypothetical protein